jgi:hypothetical protein
MTDQEALRSWLWSAYTRGRLFEQLYAEIIKGRVSVSEAAERMERPTYHPTNAHLGN